MKNDTIALNTVTVEQVVELFNKHNITPTQNMFYREEQENTISEKKLTGCCPVGIMAYDKGRLLEDFEPISKLLNIHQYYLAGIADGFDGDSREYSLTQYVEYDTGYDLGRKIALHYGLPVYSEGD